MQPREEQIVVLKAYINALVEAKTYTTGDGIHEAVALDRAAERLERVLGEYNDD